MQVFENMASQMAQLLANSDLDELTTIVQRWVKEAPTPAARQQYVRFGQQMLALKRRFIELPVAPSQQELETMLDMMLHLAAQTGPEKPDSPVG